MTIQRNSEDHFDAAPPAVASAVRAVLARGRRYFSTNEETMDAVFKARIRPTRWLPGTDLTIQLQPSPDGTQVVARGESERCLLGDVFDFYHRYIRNFLRELHQELQKRKSATIGNPFGHV